LFFCFGNLSYTFNTNIPDKTLNINSNALADDSSTTMALALAGDQETINFENDYCITKMKEGSVMLKYTRTTKPHFRKFVLTQDELKLVWGSPNKASTEAQVPLVEVKKILLGQQTAIFQRYRNPDLDGLSFSLLYKDRTLDIVCKDKREYVIWVQGLQYLIENNSKRPASELAAAASSPEVGAGDLKKEKQKFKDEYTRIGDGYTWGQGLRGALGHGNQDDVFEPSVMKDFLFLDVESMACENSAAAAIMTTGELFTWGAGEKGKLGHGDENDRIKPTLVKALQGKKVTKVQMGNLHTLALDDGGSVWTFGDNQYGQLGVGSAEKLINKPVLLLQLKTCKVVDIACGTWHSGALTASGQVLTWGRGEDGQLGHNDKANRDVPTQVNVLYGTKIVQLAFGLWHSLAVSDAGQVFTWGNASYGQLGHGNSEQVLFPKQVQGALASVNVKQIVAGSAHSGCVTQDGQVYMWGNGIYGQSTFYHELAVVVVLSNHMLLFFFFS